MLSKSPDGGYGWIVVGASFWLHAFMEGLTNAYGVFMPTLIDHFKCTRAQACAVGSILSGCTFFFGPLANIVNKYLECRTTALIGSIIAVCGIFASVFATSIFYLYISIGLVTAVGFGLAYFPSMVAVNELFHKRQSLAVGIAVCGTGIGTSLFAPLSGILIRTYGFRGAYLVISAIISNSIPASLLIRSLNKKTCASSKIHLSNLFTSMKELLTNKTFVLFLLSNFLTCMGYNAPFILLVDFVQTKGLNPIYGEYLLSLIGIWSTIGRIVIGFVADLKWVNRLQFYNFCLIISGIVNIIEGHQNTNFIYHAIYAGIFGFFSGGYVTLTSISVVDIVGIRHLSSAFGLILLFQGTSTFLGPPLWGHIFDLTGSYAWSFTCFGSIITISGLMLLPIAHFHSKQIY